MTGFLCWAFECIESVDAEQRIANLRFNFVVSGGFAIVQPGSQLSINAVEGFPLEDFTTDVCPVPDMYLV